MAGETYHPQSPAAREQRNSDRDPLGPGNMGVEGNERADEAAKAAAETLGARRCPERFALLAHINRTITERKWKEARHWFKTKHEAQPYTQRARYDPSLDTQGPDAEALGEAASTARRYFQLKSGHAVTGAFLRRIGKRDSDRCWDCTSRTRMDVHHVMYNCQA